MINTMQNLGDIPQAVIGSYLVTLDDNGRIKTDESRGVTNVKYNPLGLPSSITMGSEFTIINSYLSDGRLINETMREYYLAQVKRYDRVTGDTIIVYMPRLVSSVSRRHLGDFIIEAGKNPRSYYDWGYVEWLSDNTVRYYYYERDHQGSVRTVRDASFGVVQSTAYTVSGLPMTRIYSGVGDHHLHTGKPWQDTGGLAWYNNRARWYDPITMRFLAPDPLADKYHDISPWAWCGNNPLRYVDLNGKDNYAIDRIGNISLLNKNDDPLDCIFSPNNSSFIIVSKSFIKSQNNEVVKTINSYSNDCEEVLVTTFSSNNLRYVYEFMKDNTDVEWSFVKTENNNIETNYIGTSHIDGVDVSQEYIVKKISSNDNVIELRHVHPNGSLTVSLGDVDVAKLIQTSFPDARFFIDIPFSDENKQYDSKSTPGLLPELIVIP